MGALGRVMHGSLLLQLLILLVVANGTAVAAKKLLGVAFARPLDGGALFVDGQPLFGPSKTIRGIVLSVLATSICAALIGLGWEVGILVATFAMAGDLFSSFVKRRLHLASSSMAIGLDHIPKSLFPLLASRLLLPLSMLDIVAGVTIFVVGGLNSIAHSFQVESSRRAPLTAIRECPLWVKSELSSQYRFMSALPPKADISVACAAGRIYEYTP